MRTFQEHQGKVYSVAFSLDGQTIASAGCDRAIKFWKLDGTLLANLPTHQGVISEVVFSPDGALLASGSWDNTAILWNLKEAIALDHVEQIGCQPKEGNWLSIYT